MKPRYLITGLIIAIALVAGVLLIKGQIVIEAPTAREVGVKSKGPADAPIHMIEFSDFQCPACRVAIPVIEKIFELFPGQILFEFHHFPLGAHRHAVLAHQAAECAASMGNFWAYHDRLYDEQVKWSHLQNPAQNFLVFARDLDFNLEAFAACLTDEKITQEIRAHQKKGNKLRVQSTPTFFINGERFAGSRNLMEKGIPFIRKELGLPESDS